MKIRVFSYVKTPPEPHHGQARRAQAVVVAMRRGIISL